MWSAKVSPHCTPLNLTKARVNVGNMRGESVTLQYGVCKHSYTSNGSKVTLNICTQLVISVTASQHVAGEEGCS